MKRWKYCNGVPNDDNARKQINISGGWSSPPYFQFMPKVPQNGTFFLFCLDFASQTVEMKQA